VIAYYCQRGLLTKADSYACYAENENEADHHSQVLSPRNNDEDFSNSSGLEGHGYHFQMPQSPHNPEALGAENDVDHHSQINTISNNYQYSTHSTGIEGDEKNSQTSQPPSSTEAFGGENNIEHNSPMFQPPNNHEDLGDDEVDLSADALVSLPPLPLAGETKKSRSHRFDNGQIQEYLSEFELGKIREGYTPDNAFALACFKRPQNQSIKNAIAKNPKGHYSEDTRRARITIDEWVALQKLRGEVELDYEKVYRGKIPREERLRGNAFLVARLARLKNGDKSRNRRPKATGQINNHLGSNN
jgi:hypothetical protein